MAYTINGSLVINDSSSVIHESFPQPGNLNYIGKIPGTAAGDDLGYSVSIGSGRVVFGAPGSVSSAGAVYIFDLDANYITGFLASDAAASDFFGRSVAVGNGRVVVGSPQDTSEAGSAYIFDLDGNQLAKIVAPDIAFDDYFGHSVAVGSGRIVVGAYLEDPGGVGNAGSAYIYDLDGNFLKKITSDVPDALEEFGTSVAIGNGRIVVGAAGNPSGMYCFDLDGNLLFKKTGAIGYGESVAVGNGKIVVGNRQAISNRGAAYIYDLDGNFLKTISASDGAEYDYFGRSVSVGSGRIVVGAYNDDLGATGNAGSAYIFDLDGNQLSKITGIDIAGNDLYGWSVAAGNGRIAIGAYQEDDAGNSSGSVYFYSISEDHNTYWERILDTYKY